MPDAENPAKKTERQYGVGHKLVGKNYPTPDLYAKVTGAAKYAEDFRAEGMLFCKLLLSPMPHARVKHIDVNEALLCLAFARFSPRSIYLRPPTP